MTRLRHVAQSDVFRASDVLTPEQWRKIRLARAQLKWRNKKKARRALEINKLWHEMMAGVPGAGKRFNQYRLGVIRGRLQVELGHPALKKANEVKRRMFEEKKRRQEVERMIGACRP